MTDDERENYLEGEYAGFEKRFLPGIIWWRLPPHSTQGTLIYELFNKFCEKFPDHPNEYNTFFYLCDNTMVSPKSCFILLHCDHFEYSSLEDVRELVDFLEYVGSVLTCDGSVCIELLGGEKLDVCFNDPPADVIAIFRERAPKNNVANFVKP